jgi:hypothetical protein
MSDEGHRFRFVVLGRYPARLKGNQTAVTVNMSAGVEGHLVYCGTLTLAESEFATLVDALRRSLQDAVETEDHTQDHTPA